MPPSESSQLRPRAFADDAGVWLKSADRPAVGIRFDEIFAVSVHNLDLVTRAIPVLILDFSFGEFIEFDSEIDGFSEVVAAITQHLPGFPANGLDAISTVRRRETVRIWRRSLAEG